MVELISRPRYRPIDGLRRVSRIDDRSRPCLLKPRGPRAPLPVERFRAGTQSCDLNKVFERWRAHLGIAFRFVGKRRDGLGKMVLL